MMIRVKMLSGETFDCLAVSPSVRQLKELACAHFGLVDVDRVRLVARVEDGPTWQRLDDDNAPVVATSVSLLVVARKQ